MGVTCQNVLIAQDRGSHRFPFGIIHLHDGLGRVAKELRIVELMAAIFLAVKRKLPIAKRQLAIALASRYLIGKHTAHRVFAFIRDYALTQIHHATALGHDSPTLLSKVLDGFATSLISNQCFEVFLWIAAGEVENPTLTLPQREGTIKLWIEKYNITEGSQAVDGFLVEEGKSLVITSDEELPPTPPKEGP